MDDLDVSGLVQRIRALKNGDKAAACPICGLDGWKTDAAAAAILGLSAPYTVLACPGCGQRKLEPQLTGEDKAVLYGEGYFNAIAWPESSRGGVPSTARNYVNDVALGRHAKFVRSLEELRRLFPSARTFLDVGAATGDMVHLARRSGLLAEGIELSSFAVDQAKQRYDVDLQPLPLSKLSKNGYYDIIHLNHVFEHFDEPSTELEHIHRLLKPGGALYIEIPYQFHVIERLLFRLKSRAPECTLGLHDLKPSAFKNHLDGAWRVEKWMMKRMADVCMASLSRPYDAAET